MELATANAFHRKNKVTEDLHKMCKIKQSSAEIQKKGKICVLGAVKNGTRNVYSVQHGEKLV